MTGLEPVPFRSTGGCSCRLSYMAKMLNTWLSEEDLNLRPAPYQSGALNH
jgi:hypothetical protein